MVKKGAQTLQSSSKKVTRQSIASSTWGLLSYKDICDMGDLYFFYITPI
jgi:hypothetical protein